MDCLFEVYEMCWNRNVDPINQKKNRMICRGEETNMLYQSVDYYRRNRSWRRSHKNTPILATTHFLTSNPLCICKHISFFLTSSHKFLNYLTG